MDAATAALVQLGEAWFQQRRMRWRVASRQYRRVVRGYRNELSRRLPDYMLPAQFVLIEAAAADGQWKRLIKQVYLLGTIEVVVDWGEHAPPVTPTEMTRS